MYTRYPGIWASRPRGVSGGTELYRNRRFETLYFLPGSSSNFMSNPLLPASRLRRHFVVQSGTGAQFLRSGLPGDGHQPKRIPCRKTVRFQSGGFRAGSRRRPHGGAKCGFSQLVCNGLIGTTACPNPRGLPPQTSWWAPAKQSPTVRPYLSLCGCTGIEGYDHRARSLPLRPPSNYPGSYYPGSGHHNQAAQTKPGSRNRKLLEIPSTVLFLRFNKKT